MRGTTLQLQYKNDNCELCFGRCYEEKIVTCRLMSRRMFNFSKSLVNSSNEVGSWFQYFYFTLAHFEVNYGSNANRYCCTVMSGPRETPNVSYIPPQAEQSPTREHTVHIPANALQKSRKNASLSFENVVVVVSVLNSSLFRVGITY